MKLFAFPVVGSLAILVGGLVLGGPGVLLTLVILGILEISLSFDNAVINAVWLKKMSPAWQRAFLTVGILIAVFGMRLLFPLVIVALASHTSLNRSLDLALHHPNEYKTFLASAHQSIATFGATFLGMIFLDFMTDEREITWLGPFERFMAKVGKLDVAAVAIMLAVLAATAHHTLFAGVLALALYLVVGMVSGRMEARQEPEPAWQPLHGISSITIDGQTSPVMPGSMRVAPLAKAGLGAFLYLELMDASFSFDGVMAAFAITTNIALIALGLGIGALYIRTLTVLLVRKGVLKELVHLEHGAHYAIGALSLLLFVSLYRTVPEWVPAATSILAIGGALLTSLRRRSTTN